MAKNKMGGSITSGTMPQGELGRAGQAVNSVGNDRVRSPITTSTKDLRDKNSAHFHQNIAVTNEVGPVRKGRGNHPKGILGAQ